MAKAFARIHGAGKVVPFSAGSRPSGQVNPKAVEAMRELGYDLTQHRSKSLSALAQSPLVADQPRWRSLAIHLPPQ
jgi:protein-tyrosine-phosphatase